MYVSCLSHLKLISDLSFQMTTSNVTRKHYSFKLINLFQHLATLSTHFPNIKAGIELLNAMEVSPDYKRADPSEEMMVFLSRLEETDPNDNKGVSWGHYQYTGGGMTCRSVMTSWVAVGNTDVARRLIAAAIRITKVARYVCERQNINAGAYTSDMYLEIVIEHLWMIWKAEREVSSVLPSCIFTRTNCVVNLAFTNRRSRTPRRGLCINVA